MGALVCRAWYNRWTIEISCQGLSTVFSHEPVTNFDKMFVHLKIDQ